MDYINETGCEPGTYADENGRVVVLTDFITHAWDATQQLQNALAPNYTMVVRPLTSKEHVRELYPLDVFKSKFHKK